jgi:prephenate dehydratase
MDPHNKLSNSDDTRALIVSFLGPISSYTHQVLTLAHLDRPAWSIGLTDFDLAQAALGCFEADRYDYKAEITIPGTT